MTNIKVVLLYTPTCDSSQASKFSPSMVTIDCNTTVVNSKWMKI